MRRTSASAALLLLLAAVVALGCGDSGDGGSDPVPAPSQAEDFPKPRGMTITELRNELGPGPVLGVAVSELEPGKNRIGFGIFDRARKQVITNKAALYIAPVDGGPVSGPFPARYESLEVKPQFQSEGVKADPDAATSLYVANVKFPKPGTYEVLGAVELDDNLAAATSSVGALRVVKDTKVPEPGEPAPRTHPPPEADVGGDVAQIDTRVPPSTMHEVDFADILGEKPAVLVFATPALCQSRVCGPMVDIAEEVKAGYDGDAEFIHMEIYNDNEVEKGLRPQVVAWNLQTEPWVFTIDREGNVVERYEGVLSVPELEEAVARAD